MAKEKFLIIARQIPDDCFGAFSETENKARIDAGLPSSDPYGWIEASFQLQLVRHREATHLCSFTPSAYFVWLENAFVGVPNEAWEADGDPKGLERESGGEWHGYDTYRDTYDRRFICDTFTVDSIRDMGMRKPNKHDADAMEAYHDSLWEVAEQAAHDIAANGLSAPILDVFTYRQWERQRRDAIRARSLADSKRNGGLISTMIGPF